MKIRILTSVLAILSCALNAQTAADTWGVKFSDAMISRYQPNINNMTSKGWEYSNSIILHGMEKVYAHTADADYLNYIKTYVDAYVDGSGNITGMAQNLDKIHPGLLCLFLYEETGLAKYKTAADYIRNYLIGPSSTYPKTSGGGYWHKNNGSYNNIMMVDGIYMAHPFLAKYGSMFGDNAALDTAASQALLLASYVHDNTLHLVKHAYDDTKTQAWADPSTGVSYEVWSRGMGWYVMALVDILKYLPSSHPDYNSIVNLMADLAIGIANTQDPATGLWYQVVDKGGNAGNFLETSGSAMFVYALKTAVDSGWINASYLTVAQDGWTGLQTKISTYTDGLPAINDFAPAMGVLLDYAAYVAKTPVDAPTASGTQHPHGFAAILMAAAVMEFPITPLPVKFTSLSAKTIQNNVQLFWKNEEDSDIEYYNIQRSANGADFTIVGNVMSSESSAYTWTDQGVSGNTIYYRVQAVSYDGSVYYSPVISVKRKGVQAKMVISPNPVINGYGNLLLNQVSPGRYQVKIVNSAGKTVAVIPVAVEEERAVQTVPLPANLVRGFYFVQLEGEGIMVNKKMLVSGE